MVTLGKADLILVNGQFHTVDRENPVAEAVAVRDGKFLEVGTVAEVMQHHCDGTKVVDLKGHTAIPGLNDSHLHLIRGGLNYNLELRWEGVPSLADALRMLKEQALRTPSPQWVRVVGGWSEFQFAERRMPTLEEINDAAPDTPVFILHLYDRALLNRAALKAVGYTKDTQAPAGGEIVRDNNGNPTGMLIAKPNAMILYATLAKGPKLPLDLQVNSTRQFMRELNRLGLTSAIDAGGGFQNHFHSCAVGCFIALGAGSAHAGPLGSVQHPELNGGSIRVQPHRSPHGIYFPDDMPFGKSPNSRIAGHLSDSIQVMS